VTRYSHRQRSRWTGFVGIPFAVLMLSVAVFGDPLPWLARVSFVGGALLLAWTMGNFSRLTVEVAGTIMVAFGRGWPRRTIDPSTVTATRVVRNSLWHGWGIRFIRRGSLWNVWGLDAVELDLLNGRRFRIGTDEPQPLLTAIRSVTAGR
jgi:hypothetical protein